MRNAWHKKIVNEPKTEKRTGRCMFCGELIRLGNNCPICTLCSAEPHNYAVPRNERLSSLIDILAESRELAGSLKE